MEAVFVDIYYGLHCMNAGLEDVLNRLDEIGVEFRRKVDVGDFAEVYTPFHNHVRMQCNRGHTLMNFFALLPRKNASPNPFPLVEHPSGHCGRNHESRRVAAGDLDDGYAK